MKTFLPHLASLSVFCRKSLAIFVSSCQLHIQFDLIMVTIMVSDQFPSVHIIILMRTQYAKIYSRLAFLLWVISKKNIGHCFFLIVCRSWAVWFTAEELESLDSHLSHTEIFWVRHQAFSHNLLMDVRRNRKGERESKFAWLAVKDSQKRQKEFLMNFEVPFPEVFANTYWWRNRLSWGGKECRLLCLSSKYSWAERTWLSLFLWGKWEL